MSVNLERAALLVALERDLRVLRQPERAGQVKSGGEIGVDDLDGQAVQDPCRFGPIVVGNERDVDSCSSENPWFIGPCHENVAALFDSFKNSPICASPNALCSQQSG